MDHDTSALEHPDSQLGGNSYVARETPSITNEFADDWMDDDEFANEHDVAMELEGRVAAEHDREEDLRHEAHDRTADYARAVDEPHHVTSEPKQPPLREVKCQSQLPPPLPPTPPLPPPVRSLRPSSPRIPAPPRSPSTHRRAARLGSYSRASRKASGRSAAEAKKRTMVAPSRSSREASISWRSGCTSRATRQST
jgi:hypothetical protein